MNIHACLPNTRGYATKELKEFFDVAPRVYHTQLDYDIDQSIVRVRMPDDTKHFVPVGVEPSVRIQKTLYESGAQSKVGRGKETVLDKSIRSSKEHTDLHYNPHFLQYLQLKVSRGLEDMKAGTLRSLKPHKLVVYGPDDFFSEHMDSLHTPGQSLTCVVVLSTDWETQAANDNDLIINGKSYCSEDGCMYLFHHDDKHEVIKVTSGYRVSLTFDLVVDQLQATPDEEKSLSRLIDDIRKTGARRFGFFASHTYLNKNDKDDNEDEEYKLKGTDHRLVQILKPHATMTTLDLVQDADGDWFHPDLYRIIKMAPGFSELLHELDEPDEVDEDDCYCTPHKPSSRAFPKAFEPRDDETGMFDPVKDQYKLGDVMVLHSPHNPVVTYMGNRYAHLGNEGFYGDIHENVFFLFELK